MTDRGQEQWLEADGFLVHAVEWRNADSGNGGALVLLVHGLGGHTISSQNTSFSRDGPRRTGGCAGGGETGVFIGA